MYIVVSRRAYVHTLLPHSTCKSFLSLQSQNSKNAKFRKVVLKQWVGTTIPGFSKLVAIPVELRGPVERRPVKCIVSLGLAGDQTTITEWPKQNQQTSKSKRNPHSQLILYDLAAGLVCLKRPKTKRPSENGPRYQQILKIIRNLNISRS